MSDQPPLFQPQGLLRGFQLFVTSEEEALDWWDSYQAMPRFLFLHLWDVHEPYNMPFGRAYRSAYEQISEQWQAKLRSRNIPVPQGMDSFLEQRDRYRVGLMQQLWERECGFRVGLEEYLAGLVTFDRGRLGDLASALKQRSVPSDCLTVVTSDHGEGRDIPPLSLCRHGNRLTDDQIRIPLLMNIPGVTQRRTIGDQISQVDIAPTMLDALGLLGERTSPRTAYAGRSLLPLLHGETLPPRAAYAEISTAVRDITDRTKDFYAGRDPLIRYRSLRYPERKYMLVGKHIDVSDQMLAAPAADLLRTLFHDLLGRRASDEDTAEWLPQIEAIPPSDINKRRALLRRFEQSGEFQHLPRYAVFDLRSDPLELKPSDARSKPALWADYQPQLEAMLELDRHERPGKPLITNEADEEIILKRLQGLGYVD